MQANFKHPKNNKYTRIVVQMAVEGYCRGSVCFGVYAEHKLAEAYCISLLLIPKIP